jgi:outer membrane protein
MHQTDKTARLGFNMGLAIALVGAMAGAHAADTDNTLQLGYAHIGFNTRSGDLAGPAGTTPPGVEAHLKDASTLAMVYTRTLSGPWSVVLQMGIPPSIKIDGAGNGTALGRVGSAKAWFPAVLAQYTYDGFSSVLPYVGAGINHASYSGAEVSSAYTTAFGGTSSSADLKGSWGYVYKVGLGIPLSRNWVIDGSYSRYAIRTTATITTATPGVGNIARTIGVKANPDVFGVTLGYRF